LNKKKREKKQTHLLLVYYLLVVDRCGCVWRTTNEAVSSDIAYARRYKRSCRMQMSPCVLFLIIW